MRSRVDGMTVGDGYASALCQRDRDKELPTAVLQDGHLAT